MESVLQLEDKKVYLGAKMVDVIDVFYTCEGTRRHAYFHPQSVRLEKFKDEFANKIISVTDARIPKGKHWIN